MVTPLSLQRAAPTTFSVGRHNIIPTNENKTVFLLLDPVYGYLDRLLVAVKSKENNIATDLCRHLHRDCLRLQIGSVIAGLTSFDLWPRKGASEITMSPRSLLDALLSIAVSNCKSNDFSPKSGPYSPIGAPCGVYSQVIVTVQKVRDDSHSITTTKQRLYMRKQRRQWDRNQIQRRGILVCNSRPSLTWSHHHETQASGAMN